MRRSLRLLARLFVVAVIVSTALLASGWFALHGSLPQYDGDVHNPALSKAVEVERDALGTATLRGSNRRDLDWTLGYVHAQERYFEMDLLRRRAAGELAELFGKVALPADRTARAHRMRARMQAAITALPQEQRDAIEAYRDGVNAGLAALSVRPFAYLLTRSEPTPWRNEDTLLVVAAMAFTLNDAENKRELAFAQMHAALPESAFRFLVASGGSWDAPIAGGALSWPDPPTPAELDLHALDPKLLRHDAATVGWAERERCPTFVALLDCWGSRRSPQPAPLLDDDRVYGSNSFAVNGALAGGAALLANDMHLDLRVPSLWFRTRLVYPDPRHVGQMTDITGASLPGTPAIVVGSNGHVAWGFTNSYIDATDWVRVIRDPQDPDRYRTTDGWTSISKHEEIIRVHGAADESLAVEETRWGPIIGKDADGTPLALAWTAQQPGAINVELPRIEQAETVDEAVAIAQVSGVPPQNFLVGDKDGSIAWTIAGRIPKRIGGFDASLPADWSQPGIGWDGWLDARDVPLIANPPWQRLWTANQRLVEGAALATLGDGGYDLGARALQIRDGLRARARFTPADLLAIQLDDRALFLERWKDLLGLELNRAPSSALNDAMKRALADWNGHASTDSVAYRLVRAWRNEVIDTVLDGFAAAVRGQVVDFALPKLQQGEHAVWKLVGERPAHLLPPGYADWDALLIACAERAGKNLDAQPRGLAERTWGERNTMRIVHPLSRALPAFVARWLDMPYQPLPGDSNMPRVQGPAFGASERFAVAPADEEHGYFMMPGGQSGHPLSPYYGAGHADWATGTPTPFLPGPAQHVVHFVPALSR
ncbi:penicillin acylase family protein [Dokdonella soli]|uniref:Penicillin acylase family protein n=1 Tax=Dokdonella soli TaxID=529810 RepID=A0ABN1ITQ4_9GAMM